MIRILRIEIQKLKFWKTRICINLKFCLFRKNGSQTDGRTDSIMQMRDHLQKEDAPVFETTLSVASVHVFCLFFIISLNIVNFSLVIYLLLLLFPF